MTQIVWNVYTLDTNTILYYLKAEEKAVTAVESIYSRGVPVYVSAITEAELFGYPALSDEEAGKIDVFLKTVSIIPIDSYIARLSGMVRRIYHLKIPDSIIAATTLFTGTTLLTRNTRDFRRVSNLQVEGI